jgi:hypothetical protein
MRDSTGVRDESCIYFETVVIGAEVKFTFRKFRIFVPEIVLMIIRDLDSCRQKTQPFLVDYIKLHFLVSF